MKKSYLITIILLFSAVFAYAALQGGKIGQGGEGDVEAAEKGFDMMSAAIGLIIGAIGGFFAGKMNAKTQ